MAKNRKNKSFALDLDIFEAIEVQRGRRMRSPFVCDVLRKALCVGEKPTKKNTAEAL